MSKKPFSIIVAATASSMGIGKKGDLPWRISEDMNFFKTVTTTLSNSCDSGFKNAVIMGRKTWESIPPKFRPLSDRVNIVLTKNPDARTLLQLPENVLIATSLDEALLKLNTNESKIDSIFVIGGSSLFAEALKSKLCNRIYLTEVELNDPDIDTFFPIIPRNIFQLVKRSEEKSDKNQSLSYRFMEFSLIDQ
jgi:dihydrofolate reductase